MTAHKLEDRENTRPQITYNEMLRNAARTLFNRLCGIALITVGMISAKFTGDGTAAVMLLVMGLAAIFNRD